MQILIAERSIFLLENVKGKEKKIMQGEIY